MKNDLYFGYGIDGNTGILPKYERYTFKTSNTLMDNITRKATLNLFEEENQSDEMSESTKEDTQEPVISYRDKKGKGVVLSIFQLKTMIGLALWLDSHLKDEKVRSHIEGINDMYLMQRSEDSSDYSGLVSCMIHIPSFAKLVYGKERIGGTETRKIRTALTQLSEIKQSFLFMKERPIRISCPLIILGKEVETIVNGKAIPMLIEVHFEDVFLHEINNQYSLAPRTILQLWNETGVKSELFGILLMLLVQRRGMHVRSMESEISNFTTEAKKNKMSEDEFNKRSKALKKKALTYSEGINSILERLAVNKYTYKSGSRKGRVRFEILRDDLTRAVDALRKIGIISDYEESTAADGAILCNFIFNEKWITDETDKMKQLR